MSDPRQSLSRSPLTAFSLKMTATSITTLVQPPQRPRRLISVASLMWLFVFLLSLQFSGCYAQVAPPSTGSYQTTVIPGSVSTKTQFIIMNGFVVTASNFSISSTSPFANQLIALDLTVPWNASRPVWAALKSNGSAGVGPADPTMAIAGPTLAAPSIVLSQDGKYLNTFGSNFLSKVLSYRYTFATGTWAASSIMATAPNVYDRQVAQDTDTGLVYLPGGYGNSTYNSLLVYDFDSDSIVKNLTIPALIPGSIVALWPDRTGYYSVVYTSYRQSLLFYGGLSTVNDTIPVPGLITEYVPATNTWSIATTQGTGPSHRALQCMVTNADGTKIVVLGGALDTGVFANDLWVLDVPSMTWTQGPAAPQARAGSACTIMNDTLINWGGYNGLYPQPVDLFLYSVKSNKFITEYKPTPPPKTSPPPKPTGGNGNNSTDTSSTGGSKNKGAVIGGSIAVVVILAAAIGAGFFCYRRKRPLRWKAVFQAKDRDRGSSSDGQGKDAEVVGSYSQSTAPRLETALLGFVPSYRHGESGPEVVPMKEEFHEEEKQWWRGSNPSRPYPATTGDKDEWMQKENARIATAFTNGCNTGIATAAAANSPSILDPKQQARDSVLNSPDSVRTTTSSLVGTPSTLVNQLPYQQQQYQRYEQQQWPSPASPMTTQQQQPAPPLQPWNQQQQQQQQQQSPIQQNQQGLVSPPPLNYSTRPRG